LLLPQLIFLESLTRHAPDHITLLSKTPLPNLLVGRVAVYCL
jgi:hypothetical protein